MKTFLLLLSLLAAASAHDGATGTMHKSFSSVSSVGATPPSGHPIAAAVRGARVGGPVGWNNQCPYQCGGTCQAEVDSITAALECTGCQLIGNCLAMCNEAVATAGCRSTCSENGDTIEVECTPIPSGGDGDGGDGASNALGWYVWVLIVCGVVVLGSGIKKACADCESSGSYSKM